MPVPGTNPPLSYKRCRVCNEKIDLDDKFCRHCGWSQNGQGQIIAFTTTCPRCGVNTKEGDKFCYNCGSSFVALQVFPFGEKCPVCRSPVDNPDATFCANCGTPIKAICGDH